MSKSGRKWRFAQAVSMAALGVAALAAGQSPAKPSGYVGVTVCKMCHPGHYKSYLANPMSNRAAMLAAAKRAGLPAVSGCESCHGPGAAHVQAMSSAGGDKAKIQAIYKRQLEYGYFVSNGAQANSARCLRCHSTGLQQAHFAHSVHLENNVGCLNCHTVHGKPGGRHFLRASQPQLCYQCHLQQRAQFELPWHHRVNEGLVRCSDCHDPHGSLIQTQLHRGPAGDQVCFKCHEDKQGPFVYEHEPVKTEGCTDCHTPHGSPNPHLLKVANVNQLCLQCHTASSFSGAPGTPSFHNQAAQFQACTLCHTQIHGSNLDPAFTR